jgi:nitroreductase
MELYQGLNSRKSFRAFRAGEIERQVLTRVLEAANRSPSYMNTQPWEVFAVTGDTKNRLAEKLFDEASKGTPAQPDLPFPKEWPPAIDQRAKDQRLRRFKFVGIDPNDQEKIRENFLSNFQFYQAPCVLFVGMDKSLTPWSIFDLGSFTSHLLLAAHSEGLGCCPQAIPMAYPEIIREELGISPDI